MPRLLPPDSPEGTVWFGGHPENATLCLRFCDESLDPEEITGLMGCIPSRSQRKGQRKSHGFGKKKLVARIGSWLLDYSLGQQETIEEGIESLLSTLPSDVKIWKALGQRFRVDLLCNVFVRGVNQGFELSPRVLNLLTRRGIKLGVDIYCKADNEQAAKLRERLRS